MKTDLLPESNLVHFHCKNVFGRSNCTIKISPGILLHEIFFMKIFKTKITVLLIFGARLKHIIGHNCSIKEYSIIGQISSKI